MYKFSGVRIHFSAKVDSALPRTRALLSSERQYTKDIPRARVFAITVVSKQRNARPPDAHSWRCIRAASTHRSARLGACACARGCTRLRSYIRTHAYSSARARAQLVHRYVVSERKVVSGLGIQTMKGSHPFVLRQNSDTARTRGGRDPTRVGGTERERAREKERARRRGHVVSSRSVVILREYL